jgi:hypothetical protein
MMTTVYEFARDNDREIVRATLQEFEGREVFDLRVWLPRSSDGVLVPGTKGLSVDRSLLPELERAVIAARIASAAEAR